MIKFINENLKGLVYLCIIFFFLTACARVPRVNRYGLPQREYVYQEPEATDDGWEISSLRGEGVEEQKLHEMMHEILSGNSRYVHSILLIKNGKLIFEEYFFGYGRDTDHFLASVSKSVTSLIIGVAINKGYVPDVDTLAYEIFSDYYWDQFPDGTIQTDGGLYLRPRDMAKIGYMVLQKGQWRGRQIVSQEWIAESTQTYING